jgi:hypothetical protein
MLEAKSPVEPADSAIAFSGSSSLLLLRSMFITLLLVHGLILLLVMNINIDSKTHLFFKLK